MKNPNNSIFITMLRSPAALLILLCLLVLWSFNSLGHERANAHLAAEDLAQCRQLAADIESLRQKPAVASAQPIETREIAKRVESAAQDSAIPQSSIGEITPQPAQRMGNLPYLQKPTTLTLRNITLPQLGPFLHRLTLDSGLSIRDLRLVALKHEESGATWNADIVLSSLIYSPAKTDQKP